MDEEGVELPSSVHVEPSACHGDQLSPSVVSVEKSSVGLALSASALVASALGMYSVQKVDVACLQLRDGGRCYLAHHGVG